MPTICWTPPWSWTREALKEKPRASTGGHFGGESIFRKSLPATICGFPTTNAPSDL